MQQWVASLAILVLVLSGAAAEQGGRGGAAQGGRGGAAPGARGGPAAAPARPVAGNGLEVPGWWARLDDPKEGRQGLKVAPSGGGIRAVTGPNAIFWDPQQYGEGQYTVRANFTLNKPPSHEVAYGLFIGGMLLDQDTQRYTYFVIRPDGKYLIRKRTGAKVVNVAGDWADHAAVAKADASGRQVNDLAIRVAKDAVTFLVNGQEVAKQPRTAVDTAGVVGLRIGHGLDLQVDKFGVTEEGAKTN